VGECSGNEAPVTHRILLVVPPGVAAHRIARTWLENSNLAEARGFPTVARLESSLVAQVARILPEPSEDSRGLVDASGLLVSRPFRAPHHTVSTAGLVGGGGGERRLGLDGQWSTSWPRPGEVSLAHEGTLLLDEVTEFRRDALAALFDAIDAGFVELNRGSGMDRWVYPAAPALVIGIACSRYTREIGKILPYFAEVMTPNEVRHATRY